MACQHVPLKSWPQKNHQSDLNLSFLPFSNSSQTWSKPSALFSRLILHLFSHYLRHLLLHKGKVTTCKFPTEPFPLTSKIIYIFFCYYFLSCVPLGGKASYSNNPSALAFYCCLLEIVNISATCFFYHSTSKVTPYLSNPVNLGLNLSWCMWRAWQSETHLS